MKKILCVLLFSIITFPQFAAAETYYVRTDGKNNNTGLVNSAGEAWATIQYAADNATPEDIILVQAGTYPENVTITKTGASGYPITFQGVGDVYLSSINFPGTNVFSRAVHYYITIDNFKLRGDIDVSVGTGIHMFGAANIIIKNSSIEGYSRGINFVNNAWVACSNITIRNTEFRDNVYGASARSSGMLRSSLFENCTFVGNTYGFIAQSWGSVNITFSRSVFDGNNTGILLSGGGVYFPTRDNKVYRSIFTNNEVGVHFTYQSYKSSMINSDFYGSDTAGILVQSDLSSRARQTCRRNPDYDACMDYWLAYYNSRGPTVVNSILMNNGTFGIKNDSTQTIYANHNLAHGNTDGPANNIIFDANNNSLIADPKLSAPEAGDFSLTLGSPAIDAGNPSYDSDPDVAGNHIDIGAIEYTGPQTPSELLEVAIEEVSEIPESFLKNKNNSLPLSKKLYVAMKMVSRGDEEEDLTKKVNFYHSALQKLEKDVLPKTDGCATSGSPDANDWIEDCETQADFYEPIMTVIEMLREE